MVPHSLIFTIYRASGFVLTQINKSFNLARKPNGAVDHKI